MKLQALCVMIGTCASGLLAHEAMAQEMVWTGDFGGNLVSSAPVGWSRLDANNPQGFPLFVSSTPWTTATGGQVLDVIVTSPFLFGDTASGVHLAIGANHAPVYSGGFYPNYTWGVEGNIASAFIIGDFGRGCSRGQGALEAIYQVPRLTWSFYWGVTGGNGLSENDVDATTCTGLPTMVVDNEVKARLRLTSYYDGSVTVELLDLWGSPAAWPITRSWQSWFVARSGSVPQNSGIAIGAIGQLPPGQQIKVEVVEQRGF